MRPLLPMLSRGASLSAFVHAQYKARVASRVRQAGVWQQAGATQILFLELTHGA